MNVISDAMVMMTHLAFFHPMVTVCRHYMCLHGVSCMHGWSDMALRNSL